MDFDKKITYLYNYKERDRSVGFSKWDVRNGMLRIELSVNTKDLKKDGEYSVILGTLDDRKIELGQIKIAMGGGEFRYMGRADNVQNTGTSYEKITDIQICTNEGIVFFGEFMEKAKEYIGYDRLYAEKRRVNLFSDDDVYDCVEIEPEDIKNAPNTNWGLMNNSFLNHGYYAYRHLILGKRYKENGFDYVIGVPGVYTRRDKNMASMFGFLNFKFSTRSDIRLSQFGYWYKTLEQ